MREVAPGVVQTLVVSQIALARPGSWRSRVSRRSARRFAGRLGQVLGRVLLVVVRSTPEYMLAYVLLQLLGPSMLPPSSRSVLHNGGIVGYLMGRHADGLDYRPDAPQGLNLYAYETVPRLYGQFLAYMLYRWEIIVRESAIFGILGVATLGYYVDAAISEFRFDAAVVLILATVALSAVIDGVAPPAPRAADRRPADPPLHGCDCPPVAGSAAMMGRCSIPVIKDVVLVGAGPRPCRRAAPLRHEAGARVCASP
jgi:phosphonate transport system permease protein